MKIFISWSGDKSKQVALLLKDWLQSVIQSVKPWMSTDDIERGSIWFNDIGNALAEVKIGIVVLTEENKNKPWILFESGALAKGLTTNRVCTFLVDLKPSDILQNPLSQFNHTEPTKEGLYKLIETINNNQENKLNDKVLSISFETFYPQFEKQFAKILSSLTVIEKKEIKEPDLIKEVLQIVRTIEKRLIDDKDRELEQTKKEMEILLSTIKTVSLDGVKMKNSLLTDRQTLTYNKTKDDGLDIIK